ncbi:30S ribosomal protein S24e [Desulfurococcaceae archaeon MEX13E-LK6-19]|nr:30S ribosomal protein S24e [Desulfurococcaceae archaeon MEX13E-LK6-19]
MPGAGKTIKIGEDYMGEVVEERYNPLIKRLEIIIRLSHIGKGTPSRGIVRKAIAEAYKAEIERVYVRKIESEYGWGVTKVEAHIYDSPERAKMFEPEYIIKRNEYAVQGLG